MCVCLSESYNLDNKLLKTEKAETRTVWKRNAAGVERVGYRRTQRKDKGIIGLVVGEEK